jgi:hypothetical protein
MAASSRALVNCDVRRDCCKSQQGKKPAHKILKRNQVQVPEYLNRPNKPIFCLSLMRSDVEADNNRKAICLMVLDRR